MNIKDIAKEAGVSIATVSRVINNTAKISVETRRRVEEAIKNANYRPNSLARELQQKRTNTIGVIISVAELGNLALSVALNAIADILNQNGYNMMIVNSRFHVDEEIVFFHTFQEKRVDGILYFATGFSESHYELLKNYPIPIVIIGQNYKELDIPCVIFDDYAAAISATQHLINKGHTEIGFIGCPMYDEATGVERRRGFEQALKKNALALHEENCYTGDFSLLSGYEGMESIINNAKIMPTGIFATTDFMAMGAICCLKDHGFNVPEDISIIGFDDVNVAAYYSPKLTTIRTDKNAIGVIGANTLLKLIQKEELTIKKSIVSYELVERESVRHRKSNQ
jgi:DNA-binding LacI/PurR family transcriptional regulator